MKKTKHALLMSAVSMLLCLSMLVGSTFAWFTDTASTGVNKIVAGNLDVELEYKVGNDWESVTESTKLFSDKETVNEQEVDNLWEPGHTEVVTLKISNAGSLALKYQLGVNISNEIGSTNVKDEAFKLSQYIKYAVLEGDKSDLTREAAVAEAEKSGTALNVRYLSAEAITLYSEAEAAKDNTKISEKIVTVVVYMPTEIGNEANYKVGAARPEITFGVTVNATQVEFENDSYGPDYDGEADLPSASQGVAEAGKETVLTSGDVSVNIPANAVAAGTKVILDVTPNAQNPGFTAKEGESIVKTFDIKLLDESGNEIALLNNDDVTVAINVGNVDGNVAVYHEAEATPIASTYYRASGIIEFETNSFSPFTVVKVEPVKVTSAEELTEALSAVQPGEMIKVNTSTPVEMNNIPAGVTIEGSNENEVTLNSTNTNGFNVANNSGINNVTIQDTNESNGRSYCGVVNLRGDGATIKNSVINGKGYATWDAAVYVNLKAGETAYLTNVEVNGGFRGVFLGSQSGSLIMDSCVINPTAYTISVDGGGDFTLVVKNSTLNGWLSYSAIKSATFTNCKFGSNGSYAFYRPYSASTLIGCDFETGYEIDSSKAPITLENCTIAGVALTTQNAGVLFGGTVPANVTIK